MNKVSVPNEKIIRLQYSANGFQNAFFLVFASFQNNGTWDQDGDIMSVLGTTGSFAIELYLKLLMVVASFDCTTNTGEHIRGHKLDELYDGLQSINPSFITDLEKDFQKSNYSFSSSLKAFLTSIKENFIDWRYCYDKGTLNVNLNTMCDTINILSNYSAKKFLPVAEQLATSGISTQSDGQSMTISCFEDIRKN